MAIKGIWSDSTNHLTSPTTNAEELTRYTINGQKISAPSKGLNIIRYNDGSVKKVVVQERGLSYMRAFSPSALAKYIFSGQ